MRSAPQSRLFAAISWINVIVSHESRGLLERAFDLCFGEQAEELTMPTRDPSLAGRGKALVSRSEPSWREPPGETDRSSDRRGVYLSTQDDQLVP
jgi:hypothetical protein